MYKYEEIYEKIYGKKPCGLEYLIKKYFDYLFKCNILLNKYNKIKSVPLKKFLSQRIYKKYNIIIGVCAKIGNNFIIKHPIGITIGDKVVIGNNVTVYQNVTIGQKKGKYPKIEDNVVIYPNSTIIGDINVKENSIIGANCYCDKDIDGIFSTSRCFKIK